VLSRPPDRAVGLSRQLAQTHQELRWQINQLRTGLDQREPENAVLVTHRLAFCAALTSHHQGGFTRVFTELLQQRSDLAGTVSKLVEDHEMIASILSRVAELADNAAGSHGPAPEEINRELDGLVAIMEPHFDDEEQAIRKAFGRKDPPSWDDVLFGVRKDAH
jgi:hypothetical protein